MTLALICPQAHSVNWLPFGPYGGDARRIAEDPHDRAHLYLGTANGWIYESHNGGVEWKRLARIDNRDDLVLDSIVVDAVNPRRLIIGAWVLSSPDGGLYVSDDGGVTWKSQVDMAGQSIRALAAAPSDPKILVAGTLKGVYRSNDDGVHWQLISPEGSVELHEVESIAIDPKDPAIIYAGTWHLPWKTTNAGEHWANIKQGVIDDSDVFSIIVDPEQSNVVYASACSGIYKSENAGEKFDKIQGIPSTARRTRVLTQDPQQLNVVYAGTTEGLFRTSDSGKTWIRTTGPELIVNDVHVDPRDSSHVMLATDRAGVLNSNDGGFTFYPSNSGFSARQITAFVVNPRQPANLFVGVVNDKAWGGVFQSENGGLTWTQQSAGLDGQDVYSLEQASDGTLLAGTGHGIYRLTGGVWTRVEHASETPSVPEVAAKRTVARRRTSGRAPAMRAKAKVSDFDGMVFGFARAGDAVYAATSEGVLKSVTAGTSWDVLGSLDQTEWRFVGAQMSTVFVTALHSASLSKDGGQRWSAVVLPGALTQVSAVAVDGEHGLWVGGREGLFRSVDGGATWINFGNVNVRDVNSLFYDEASQCVLVTASNKNTIAFSVHVPDGAVRYWNTGWVLRMVRPVGDHLVGATLFDGVVIQPRMVNSAELSGH
ncbi:WD40/YVTN/BNR-like repeat-containing protein [Edaphobacter bradus]|uniref:WD40/YVTN/BNR-like repeat-containing protein n=1 Tax=Edaphobacter bradus TaxID=2259016 RepID=UPI0021E012E9|nr:hypothetical protein [Edaphobacter bradus]